jgi:toxin YoeB
MNCKYGICFTKNGWEEFEYWIENDTDVAIKIKELIRSIRENPFKGIGKSEPLRHDLKSFSSRRINSEHRLVYKVSGTKGVDQKCIIIQCRFHYDD